MTILDCLESLVLLFQTDNSWWFITIIVLLQEMLVISLLAILTLEIGTLMIFLSLMDLDLERQMFWTLDQELLILQVQHLHHLHSQADHMRLHLDTSSLQMKHLSSTTHTIYQGLTW